MVIGIVVAVGFLVVAAMAILLVRSDASRSSAPAGSDADASLSPTSPVGLAMRAPAGNVDFESEIRRLVEQKQLIMAIKLYRERTGLGLKESKDAIDRLAATGSLDVRGPLAAPASAPASGMDGVRQALREDKLIMAIKHYRDATGLGLREAKDAVEKMRDEMRARGEIP